MIYVMRWLAAVLLLVSFDAVSAERPLPERYRDTTLIVTDAMTAEDGTAIADRMARSLGPAGQLFFPPNVIVMRVPAERVPELQADRRVIALTRSAPTEAVAALARGPHARDGISFVRAAYEGMPQGPVHPLSPRPLNDRVVNPASRRRPAVLASNQKRRPSNVAASAANDVFFGRTAINVFWVESNGAVDVDEFTWPASLHSVQANRFSDSLWWWTYVAQAQGVSLTFSVAYRSVHSGNVEVLQPYEPIRHRSGEQYLWIEPIMANLGYTSGDEIDRLEAFHAVSRAQLLADNSFSVFMIYNPPDQSAPATFVDGANAIADIGGPFFTILYQNGGFAPADFAMVSAHEIGHQFWACDEYVGSNGCFAACGGTCSASGPRPYLGNPNCELCLNGNATCIMQHPDLAYAGQHVCTHTKQQIGW